jgi:hypothetical protein
MHWAIAGRFTPATFAMHADMRLVATVRVDAPRIVHVVARLKSAVTVL